MSNIPPQATTRVDLPSAPTKSTLEALLLNGEDFIEIVQSKIDQWKLPYFIDNGVLKDTLSQGETYLRQFITVDPLTIQMKEEARLIAKTNYPVLITGATGTGKEIIAKAMIGDRKGEPIKAVNVAALPAELVESELFGSIKGSYTGSVGDKDGLFTSAKAGIMFLDEVGELALHLQAKLLRVLQDNSIRRVGSNKDEEVKCKFVFATHRDLKKMVEDNLFREDLYARISTLELDIRPLAQRLCDCVPIAESIQKGKKFLEKYGSELANGKLDLSLNVRSIQRHIIRYDTLGKI
jgi:transcriptional regulator with GAF, ATPase, and Fis domain